MDMFVHILSGSEGKMEEKITESEFDSKLHSIERLSNESDFEYKLRLCSLKLNKEIDLDWSEIVDLLGLGISGDHLRKLSYGYKECEEYLRDKSNSEDVKDLFTNTNIEDLGYNPKRITEDCENTQIIDMGDKFHIYNSKRSIVISKDKVRKIRELYCDTSPLTINEVCRKLDIPRRDFMLLKNGMSIVHQEIPFLESDLQENSIQDLVDATLERRKEKYFIKLQQEEIRQMKGELEKYRKQDYLFNKIVGKLEPLEIVPTNYEVKINQDVPYREALLDLADLHLGEKVSNYWCQYNTQIARERFQKLTEDTIRTCAELGVKTLHVSNLGDDVSGIINETLTREAEIPVEEQVALAVELIGTMLVNFSIPFDKIIYADVFGNHSRIFIDKKSDSEKTNFEFFVSWGLKLKLQNYKDKIIFEDNVIDNTIIVKEINGVKLYEVHGDKDKLAKIASDLTMMIGKVDECHMGHFHANKELEDHEVEVFQTRSFIGVNTYAKNIRLTSKAGQRLFIYEKGKRKFIEDIVLN